MQTLNIKNMVIYILIGFIVIYLLYILSNKQKEGITNVDDENNMVIAKKVYKYYMDTKELDFVDYVNYLTSIGNTNLELIELEVFYELKSYKKKGKLTVNSVLNIMNTKPTDNAKSKNENEGQRLRDNTALMKSILQPYVI